MKPTLSALFAIPAATLFLALIALPGCEDTSTTTPTPMGQVQTPTSPYIHTTTVETGVSKTVKR